MLCLVDRTARQTKINGVTPGQREGERSQRAAQHRHDVCEHRVPAARNPAEMDTQTPRSQRRVRWRTDGLAPRWAETGSRILPILPSARASPRSAAGPPDGPKAAGSIPGNRARRTADGPARRGLLRMPHHWAHRLAGWPGTGAALLMASINSSGLPLPAHARRLARHDPFHAANPSPLPAGPPRGCTHPRGSGWTPGAPAGSGDGRGAAWCWRGEASRCQRGETLRERKDTQLRQSSPGTWDSRSMDIPWEKGPDPRFPHPPTPWKAM